MITNDVPSFPGSCCLLLMSFAVDYVCAKNLSSPNPQFPLIRLWRRFGFLLVGGVPALLLNFKGICSEWAWIVRVSFLTLSTLQIILIIKDRCVSMLDYENLFDYELHIAHSTFSGFAMRSWAYHVLCLIRCFLEVAAHTKLCEPITTCSLLNLWKYLAD